MNDTKSNHHGEDRRTPAEGFFPGPVADWDEPIPVRDPLGAELISKPVPKWFQPIAAAAGLKPVGPIASSSVERTGSMGLEIEAGKPVRVKMTITAENAEAINAALSNPIAQEAIRRHCEKVAGSEAKWFRPMPRLPRLAMKSESIEGTSATLDDVAFDPERLDGRQFAGSLAWFLVRLFLLALLIPFLAGLAIFLVNAVATFVIPVVLVVYLFLRLDPRNSSNRLDGTSKVTIQDHLAAGGTLNDPPIRVLKPIARASFRRPHSDVVNP